MKKARLTFLAVVEDDVYDAERLYSPEEQLSILKDILKQHFIGGKDMQIRVPYMNREVVNEDETDDMPDDSTVVNMHSGTYECFHCGCKSVIWQSDFMFEDYGYEGVGLVQNLTCANCGAEIEYRVPMGDPDDDEGETDGE